MNVTFGRRCTLLALAAGAVLCGASPPARAALTLTLTQTGGLVNPSLTLTDTAGDGYLTYAGGFGDFQFEMLSVTSTHGSGQAMLQDIQLSTRNTAAGERGLILTVSDDTFTTPGQPGDQMALYSSLASSLVSPGGSGTFLSSLDGQAADLLTLSGLGAVETTATVFRGPTSTFTLSNTLTVRLGSGQTGQFTGTTIAQLPEPSSLALAAAALPLLGLVSRRMRRAGAQAAGRPRD